MALADGAREVVGRLVDDFVEFDPRCEGFGPDGPLDWDGYGLSRKRAAERAGTSESVVCGRGTLGGSPTVLVAFEFRFLGGSVGTGTGARIVHAFDHARTHGLPVVSLVATGGTRMQEGVLSLRQLQLIARAAVLLRESGLPHVAVLRDPTTGGVWASLGAGADVVLALDGVQVGFAGRRVRRPEHADDPAYTARSQLATGHVDEVLDATELPGRLTEWLTHLRGTPAAPVEVPRALGDVTPAAGGGG
ncbi:MAG TPA: carboxyl transferase domain-containing protein, partial [Actinophytocola sp.]|nr:carboxyl transferase domain-containing protein [Actinophytocola sp.]